MELNGRMTQVISSICAKVFQDGDVMLAAVQLAEGILPPTPTARPNSYGLRCYLSTFGTGVARDFLRFGEITQNPNAEIFLAEEKHVVQASGEAGYKLGYMDVYGASFEDCVGQMEELKYQIFKTSENCPWFGN